MQREREETGSERKMEGRYERRERGGTEAERELMVFGYTVGVH